MAEKPGSRSPRRDGEVAVRDRERLAKPPRFKVMVYNDDYTPMEFVVGLLESTFGKSPSEATQLMLTIHRCGEGVAGAYILEVAETKISTVHRLAEEGGYPLRAGLRDE
jgi:ATP-dependent Clp protease adaptor protein ClpS